MDKRIKITFEGTENEMDNLIELYQYGDNELPEIIEIQNSTKRLVDLIPIILN